ncbi:hypothetical protein [Staphylococcus lugdunensis]|uniref:hypothetical protein n=1 Tax=Staphylococcus lugdunensis TaxID=28035 RepID=UPI000A1081AF|nr:hypothetical protein [Staphylococcus lugdunensis]ARJ26315.1 hypothetical protein B7469_01025 [Staphylococcus lugdunensis]MCH8675968.1 hypothetical protein [Staphylococcus lugdunensis]MCI2752207.1 hypothetical protein [Staphylococcus lugdunensis]MCI2761394.1 hypothetical protein [Staphylococcus lugdunensis]MCI2812558.1 hypothetical protein [Staphylococcus lugdunensis]
MGPQQRGFRKESQQTTQVGVGPQQRGFRKESQRTTQVGVLNTYNKKYKMRYARMLLIIAS